MAGWRWHRVGRTSGKAADRTAAGMFGLFRCRSTLAMLFAAGLAGLIGIPDDNPAVQLLISNAPAHRKNAD